MSRCLLCPNKHNCVGPSGPADADILFVGEAPGHNEDKRQEVFIGKTGDEVNRHYLPLAGLRRDSTRFTNAIRCLPVSAGGKLDSGRKSDLDLLESCANQFLYPEILRGRFRLIVPLGSFACRAVFGEPFDLELRHGVPTETPFGIPAFPMYHPALGIHEPKKMLHIRTDWDRLRRYLRGRLTVPVDAYPEVDYAEVEDAAELECLEPDRPLAGDTETKRGGSPYCLTYSQYPGTGRLIRAERLDLLALFNRRIQEWRAPILFHNYLYDWSVVEAMGVRLPYPRVVDTMSRVFHLGNLPQGLKALAYRELGMTMQDFEDMVKPHSTARVLDFYRRATALSWPKPEEQTVIDSKTGLWKLYKPQGMSTKFKRFWTDLGKNPDKDVFKMWTDNWVDQQSMIEEALGEEWPGMCITHAPFDAVLYYACRDADALLRLWPILKRMSRVVRRYSQEQWREHVA